MRGRMLSEVGCCLKMCLGWWMREKRKITPYCELRTIHKGGPLSVQRVGGSLVRMRRQGSSNQRPAPGAQDCGCHIPSTDSSLEPVKGHFEHPPEKDARGTGDHQLTERKRISPPGDRGAASESATLPSFPASPPACCWKQSRGSCPQTL